MRVSITECSDPTELFRQYDGQHEPQNAYIELSLKDGTLHATYDAEIGNAKPEAVRRGFDRRYGIPLLTAEAVNRVMEEIAPYADRILADWDTKPDHSHANFNAVLGEDAEEAEGEIIAHLHAGEPDSSEHFADSDLIGCWDIDGATNGDEADEYGITADTTDERLNEIEADIIKTLAGIEDDGSGVVVVDGLNKYLKSLRTELIEERREAEEADQCTLYVISAHPGDRVDGADLAELDSDLVDIILATPEVAALVQRVGYGPDNPDELLYVQSDDPELQLPADEEASVECEVPSRVTNAVTAVERQVH